jgi:dihydroflavonol-4-reductase
MRAVVTGGSGQLGSRIVRQLLARGAEVCVTYRPGDPTDAINDLHTLEHRPADLLDAKAIAHAVEGADVVFHAAAMIVFKQELYDQMMHTNIEGTRNVLNAVRKTGARRLVHTSTVSALGIPKPGSVGDETTAFNWAPYRLAYYDSKHASEQLVLDAAASDIDAVIVQPGTMFGPDDFNLNAASYIQVVERGPLVFAPSGGCCIVHVDDVAAGHLLALDKGLRGECYVLGGDPTRFIELFNLIEQNLQTGRTIRHLPEFALLAAGRIASALRKMHIPVPLTYGMTLVAASHLAYSSAKAQMELGWSHRPVTETIADAVTWYMSRESASTAHLS